MKSLVEMEIKSLVHGIRQVLNESLKLANDDSLYENESFADLANQLAGLIGMAVVETRMEDYLDEESGETEYWTHPWELVSKSDPKVEACRQYHERAKARFEERVKQAEAERDKGDK